MWSNMLDCQIKHTSNFLAFQFLKRDPKDDWTEKGNKFFARKLLKLATCLTPRVCGIDHAKQQSDANEPLRVKQ